MTAGGDARIVTVEFSGGAFRAEVAKASGCCAIDTPAAVRYLERYLGRDLAAATMVVESDYTDRHYIEEFAAYYARQLRAPPPRTARIHFFDDEAALENVGDEVARAVEGEADVESTLRSSYLGFVVVRPLPYAPIGRTVLKHIPEVGGRDFAPAKVVQSAHLAGFDLPVEGLPFQQQDQAVAACATTALWSMLSGVFRRNGSRPPVPSAITEAANLVPQLHGRRFPTGGGLVGGTSRASPFQRYVSGVVGSN